MVAVSIVIPTFKRTDKLIRLLKSISESSKIFDDIEIIIVNDDPEVKYDETQFKDIISKEVTIINNYKNFGVNISRYIGAKNSSGKYILFIDDDNVVSQNMIYNLYLDFEELDSSVAALAPVAYYYSAKDKVWWCGSRFDRLTLRAYTIKSCDGKFIETDDVHNAFMIRKEHLKYMELTLKYFKRTFSTFSFMTLLKNNGLKALVDTSAVIYHDAPYDVDKGREITLSELIKVRFDEDRIYHFFYEPIVYAKFFSKSYTLLLFRIIAQFVRLNYYSLAIIRSKIPLSKKFSLMRYAYAGYIKGILTKLDTESSRNHLLYNK